MSCFWQAAKEAAELERRRQQEAARAQAQKDLKAQEQQKKVGLHVSGKNGNRFPRSQTKLTVVATIARGSFDCMCTN